MRRKKEKKERSPNKVGILLHKLQLKEKKMNKQKQSGSKKKRMWRLKTSRRSTQKE